MTKNKTSQRPHSRSEIELPEGWANSPMKQLGADIPYPIGDGDHGQIKPSCYQTGGVPYIRVADIGWGHLQPSSMVYIPEEVHVANLKSELRPGDVIIAKTGATIGKCAIIPPDMPRANTTSSVGKVTVDERLLMPEWLLHYFLSEQFRSDMWAVSEKTAQPGFSNRSLESFIIPLAPLAEQKRIVSKVEALLESVNAARTRLAKVPAILKRFRKSVLSAACSGQLTTLWREGKNVEPTDQLLTRLLAAPPIKDELRVEYPVKRWRVNNPRRPQLDNLPSIPETWAWVYLPDLGYMNRGRSKNRPRNASHLYGGKYPFIQTGDIAQSGGRIASHKQTYSEAGLAQSRLWPVNTICITIAANIADSAILTYPACFPDSVVGLVADPELCVPEFAEFFIRTAREDLSQFAPATAQKNINIGILGEVAVPLPPLEEQREIVRRVEVLFALVNLIEAHMRAAIIRAEKLPQAILTRAFRGEMVVTEAELAAKEGREYESASVLLERIQEHRNQLKPAKRGRGGKKMTKRSSQAARRRRPLFEVLREQSKPLTPERLFDLAGFDEGTVDEFYEQLRKLIQEGMVRERRPNRKDVILETLGA